MGKTRRRRGLVPWAGWSKQNPKTTTERKRMLRLCGRKCFLGPGTSYPICVKNTCKQSRRGVYAAYVRARQYHKSGISKKATSLLSRSR